MNRAPILDRTKACQRCGAIFGPGLSPFDFNRMKFCGRACYDEGRKFSPEKAARHFWTRIDKNADGCWIFRGCKDKWGYVQYAVYQKRHQAHRYAYEQTHGPIPAGKLVMHTCDVPACVNPAHLLIGTDMDNVRDKMSKGRKACGEKTMRNKLTEADVREIRATFVPGDRPYTAARQMGKKYGVTERTILNAFDGATWSHL